MALEKRLFGMNQTGTIATKWEKSDGSGSLGGGEENPSLHKTVPHNSKLKIKIYFLKKPLSGKPGPHITTPGIKVLLQV